MKIKNIIPAFLFGLIVVAASACSTAKLSTQNNDDVYFSDISANEVVYTSVKNNTPVVNDAYEGVHYYDEGVNNSRLNGLNDLTWRDRYLQNSGLGFDPFWGNGFNNFNNFYGGNNFFNNGWSFNMGFGRPLWGFNNFYDPFFNPWNNFNSFYGNGGFGNGFGNMYSFNQFGGFYGNGFGNNGWGNNFFIDPLINARPNNPRPRGSYDNVRNGGRTGSGNIALPPNSRSTRPDGISGSIPTRTADNTRNPSSNGNSSARPTRPTGNSSGTPSGTSARPTQGNSPRPTREGGSSSTQPPSRNTDSGSSSSSGRSSSSGSSSSGGSSSPRPSRPGGN